MGPSNPESNPPTQPSGWQAILAKVKSAAQAALHLGEEQKPAEETAPALDGGTPEAPPAAEAPPPEAAPVAEAVEVAEPVEAAPAAAIAEAAPAPPAQAGPLPCPICGSARVGDSTSCGDCGYYYTEADLAGGAPAAASHPGVGMRLQDRFEVGALIGERQGVSRYKGTDHGVTPPAPVVILRQALPPAAPGADAPGSPAEAEPVAALPVDDSEDLLPSFDVEIPPLAQPVTEKMEGRPAWPSIAWELNLLNTLDNPALPAVVAHFTDEANEYLVEEVPQGQSLWDAWDDSDAPSEKRFGYLAAAAEILHALHGAQTIFEGVRPDVFVIAPDGQLRLNQLGDLLPVPLPPETPIRGSLYTAPELLAGHGKVDPRADLYSFGAMIYALHVGRELTENDFDRPGHPKPFIPRWPDIHPGFGRLLTKTFRREPDSRFPTDEAAKEDATGFTELIRTLRVLGRTMDNARMEIASWTTTGIVRTGNEDAFALIHAAESRQDDLGEKALILLCDGMGGYEAGEVAAAVTIQMLRKNLLAQPPFAALAGQSPFPTDPLGAAPKDGHMPPPVDVEQVKQLIKAALREANRFIYQTSRAPGSKRRGMGCTAEVVYVDGRNVIVGHVGDSRTYHLHEGRLIQMTRDQTLVNRLVELGQLDPEEAENHPRKNELQQAIGGQPDVEPGLYHGKLKPGDWVLVCSDGLINHVNNKLIQQMLQDEAVSAEMAARRLVNLTNIEGATDNCTVVVVRAT
jgi:serine/threonine protein phosphatase PrpC/serine/threonine protein kinase